MPNLVFKYNWDHRPIPINTGQGRLQFSLPFASGSLSLAPNFSQVQGTAVVAQGGTGAGIAEDARKNLGAAASGANSDITEIKGLTTALSVTQGGTGGETAADARSNLGLGDAATRNIGTAAGNVMEVGAFGLGLTANTPYISPTTNLSNLPNGLYGLENGGHSGILVRQTTGTGLTKLGIIGFPSDTTTSAPFYYGLNLANGTTLQQNQAYRHTFYTTQNTTVDSNGYIKAASPICNLYVDHIELNDEAKLQEIIFEKVDVGNYLIRGSLGFAQEGWYIEVPKDANGNVLVAVKYQQLESGDIQVKTFAKKFDEETGDVVPNLAKPRDIPAGRFISLRLQGLPKPEFIDDPEIMESDLTNNATATAEGAATQSPEEQPAK
ncbi:phage tail fiber protein [Acinetobacter radioresistens]|uniref:phage tail fiber protein n=1 Tax=Acinetobacter radioresistens TaxID=40216 RepID=UPI0021D0B672|nr:phage tail protein [Acinetobacter radioresistens]